MASTTTALRVWYYLYIGLWAKVVVKFSPYSYWHLWIMIMPGIFSPQCCDICMNISTLRLEALSLTASSILAMSGLEAPLLMVPLVMIMTEFTFTSLWYIGRVSCPGLEAPILRDLLDIGSTGS